MTLRFPATLKLTVPLILLGFAAVLSTVNLLYHVPQAEREAEEDSRKRLAQEMSRLQSTLEYLLLKGDAAAAQHEIAVLAHNHDVVLAALTDENGTIVTSTRRAWLGRRISDVLPHFDLTRAGTTIHERRAGMAVDSNGNEMLGHAGVLLGGDGDALRPAKTGGVFLIYDLKRYKAEARAQVVQQSLYWAGWVTALALAMWLVFHFLLTRRTARLVHAAEELAAGNLGARSDLKGTDELGRLSRAFDAMARKVAQTQIRLRRDIAERERVQHALANSEASYRAIFDAAEDAIFVHDIATGAILDVNPKACAVFGYTREEFRAIDVGSLGSGAHPFTQQEAMALMARAAAGENPCIEWHGRSKSGELRWHDVSIKRVTIGGHDRILAMARDITEKKRAADELARQREALYQREKLAALGSLLAGVAHELNNPLSVVVARAVLLEEKGDPATRTAAVKIRTAAERCARIVRTFLAMARQQPPERGAVAMNDVVSAALDIASYALRTSNIEVTLDLAPDMPPVLADADQLHQVLLNLIINAQQSLQEQALPRRVRIASRFHAQTRTIVVTVADNGPGIPPHIQARVFEPYFTTKPQGVGTGVGLAVSLGIVEAHGGTLTAQSSLDGGAVFTMVLPAGEVEPVFADAAPPARPGEAGSTILIVDDEAEIRDALADILKGARHRVVTATSGREALQRMAAAHYDVILTDIRMPDLDGRALYQAIERRWPGRAGRVVFVTGDTLASGLREFVNASGRPVIEKPFMPGEVRRVVAEVASGAALRDAPLPPDDQRQTTQSKQE
ncbi:MAG: ATP-binding protein [Casimicrobiaceae bacterium]